MAILPIIALLNSLLPMSSIHKSVYREYVHLVVSSNAPVAVKEPLMRHWAEFLTQCGTPQDVFDVLPNSNVKQYWEIRYTEVHWDREPMYIWATKDAANVTYIDVIKYGERIGLGNPWPNPDTLDREQPKGQ